MGATRLVFLIGAVIAVSAAACPLVPVYSCVNDDDADRCTATEVCEKPRKERCGDAFCEYPFVCASALRKECEGLRELKERCSHAAVCKPVVTPCGHGACSFQQSCVKERVCSVESRGGRKLLEVGLSSSTHNSRKGFSSYYLKDCPFCESRESLVCEDTYKCVAKSACQEVIKEACLQSGLQPGADVAPGGYEFRWTGGSDGKCGDATCGEGTRCAAVAMQTCSTKCEDAECGYGAACVSDAEGCKDLPYLENVCRNVTAPTCIPLSPYVQSTKNPPCKTVYKCGQQQESVCGDRICPAGHTCVVEEKRDCESEVDAARSVPIIEKPRRELKQRFGNYFSFFNDDDESGAGSQPGDEENEEPEPFYPGFFEKERDDDREFPRRPDDDEPDTDGNPDDESDYDSRFDEAFSTGRLNRTSGDSFSFGAYRPRRRTDN